MPYFKKCTGQERGQILLGIKWLNEQVKIRSWIVNMNSCTRLCAPVLVNLPLCVAESEVDSVVLLKRIDVCELSLSTCFLQKGRRFGHLHPLLQCEPQTWNMHVHTIWPNTLRKLHACSTAVIMYRSIKTAFQEKANIACMLLFNCIFIFFCTLGQPNSSIQNQCNFK